MKCNKSKDAISQASLDSCNSRTKEYTELTTGSIAIMQCHISKKWEKAVRIVKRRENGASYVIEGVDSSKQYIRADTY